MQWTSPAQTQHHAQHADSDLPENVSANGILPLFEHNGRLKFNYVMWWNTQFLFPADCIACGQCTKLELAISFRELVKGKKKKKKKEVIS